MTSEASSTKPCEVVIHRERAVAEFVWRGEISLETILAAYDEAAAHPDWRPHFNRLSVYADDLPGDGADFDIVKPCATGLMTGRRETPRGNISMRPMSWPRPSMMPSRRCGRHSRATVRA